MQHLYDGPRGPVDAFEQVLINAFSSIRNVDAIWVREVPQPGGPKRFLRSIWLQFARRSASDQNRCRALLQELQVRVLNEDFSVELHYVVDELPPAPIAPSCIWRREPLKLV